MLAPEIATSASATSISRFPLGERSRRSITDAISPEIATGVAASVDAIAPLRTEASLRSRYAQEFEQGVRLGKGGFGRVYRARHMLDGAECTRRTVVEPTADLSDVPLRLLLCCCCCCS